MKTTVQIMDYVEREQSLYIQLTVIDGETEKQAIGEVRFLGDLLYGELIHEKKSPLTEQARMETIVYLKAHFGR
ncbi:hypothetical protein [Planococcus sp. ISL-109]|uniref:hypothetical protein n=1 Tax=Planococcus sp. ISL-109 TaxID=2819166 RepID=UPI001BEC3183|nr:hypothetical protein [Planococcus sp. ISL-109]MBT2581456.1 hypothetical protein [Planococcus sp. ISL-109]